MPDLRTKDGADLSYADDGAGPAILLVHGWAAHGGFFSDLRQRLARSYRVIVPTLRGHPGSTRGGSSLTVETLGQDIAALVEKLDLTSFAALGWSMGAMALWSAAPALKQKLRALVVEDIGPRIVNGDDWAFGISGAYTPDAVASTLSEIRSDWPAYVERFSPRIVSNATRERNPALVRWAADEMAKADPAIMAEFWASMTAQDFRGLLPRVPVLAVHGEESMHPAEAIAFVANASPFGTAVTIPGAGHVPHLETPDLFFNHVDDFLRRNLRRDVLSEGVKP